MTIEGSFHSATVAKVVGALIGYVTRASIASGGCTGGRATVGQEALPWHLSYSGFTGTLPSISRVRQAINGAKVVIQTATGICQFVVNTINTWHTFWNVIHGKFESVRSDESDSIPLEGGFLCSLAGEISLRGEATVTLPGSTTALSVTLI